MVRLDIREIFDIVAETSNKKGTLSSVLRFFYFVNGKYRSGVSSLHNINEVLMVFQTGAAFAPFSPFFTEFNEQIGRMVSGGFFNFWKFFSLKKPGKEEDIGPQVLTMDHMEVALIASLLPLTFAIFAFLVEVSVKWTKIFVPRIGTYVVIKTFYKFFPKH